MKIKSFFNENGKTLEEIIEKFLISYLKELNIE